MIISSNGRKILFLYEYSGRTIKPWIEDGWEAVSVDLRENRLSHPNHQHIQTDIRNWDYHNLNFEIVIGMSPCTDLAVSGARWFKRKLEANPSYKEDALELFDLVFIIGRTVGARLIIAENPKSQIATLRRPSDFICDPWEFSLEHPNECYTKETHLWTEGNFKPLVRNAPLGTIADPNKIHYNKKDRDITPLGFAYELWRSNK